MGTVKILDQTTRQPITLIGQMAGVCWGADTSDPERRTRHTKLKYVWKAMKQRCNNSNNINYKQYGGRGITICDEWSSNFRAFETWALENGYEEGLTIDRINNNGGYSPDNCRWATRKEQSRNLRINRRVSQISNTGETIATFGSIAEASEKTGCNQVSIMRVCQGKEKQSKGLFWKYADKE